MTPLKIWQNGNLIISIVAHDDHCHVVGTTTEQFATYEEALENAVTDMAMALMLGTGDGQWSERDSDDASFHTLTS